MIYKIEKLEKDIQNNSYDYIPKQSGVYRILNLENVLITILGSSTNKKFDAYSVSDLQERYDKSKQNTVLYIGKGDNLHKRIKQYIKFGLNLVDNHKGGRSIFQIEDYKKLYVEIILCDNCECVEKNMLLGFEKQYNGLPMANRKI